MSVVLQVPHTAPTGSTLTAELVVTNRTQRPIRAAPCTRNWIVLGLETTEIPYKLPIPPPDCHFHLRLLPGVTRLQVSIPTIYPGCGQPGVGPRCTALGVPPDLPLGTYHLELATTGLQAVPGARFGTMPAVTLGTPTWQTVLHPGQGSLLVATSACLAELITSGTPRSAFKVWLIVRQHAHVFEHAVGYLSLVETYALWPGTYYVNTDLSFRHGFVHVRAGRQTIDNLDAGCT